MEKLRPLAIILLLLAFITTTAADVGGEIDAYAKLESNIDNGTHRDQVYELDVIEGEEFNVTVILNNTRDEGYDTSLDILKRDVEGETQEEKRWPDVDIDPLDKKNFTATFTAKSDTGYIRCIVPGRDDCDYNEGDTPPQIEVKENVWPTADFSLTKNGNTVNVDAGDSSSDLVGIASYEWEWGDGQTESDTDPETGHTYSSDGDYTITLNVTDEIGRWNTTQKTVSVQGSGGSNPVLSANIEVNNSDPLVGDMVEFDGGSSRGSIESYTWTFNGNNEETGQTLTTVTKEMGSEGEFEAELTVENSTGHEDTATETFQVDSDDGEDGDDGIIPDLSIESSGVEWEDQTADNPDNITVDLLWNSGGLEMQNVTLNFTEDFGENAYEKKEYYIGDGSIFTRYDASDLNIDNNLEEGCYKIKITIKDEELTHPATATSYLDVGSTTCENTDELAGFQTANIGNTNTQTETGGWKIINTAQTHSKTQLKNKCGQQTTLYHAKNNGNLDLTRTTNPGTIPPGKHFIYTTQPCNLQYMQKTYNTQNQQLQTGFQITKTTNTKTLQNCGPKTAAYHTNNNGNLQLKRNTQTLNPKKYFIYTQNQNCNLQNTEN